MKVNIKGLVFTGFAAAILSANAMAAGENVVTSKSFTEHTYQHKSTGASIGNDSGTWTPLDVTVPEENASSSTAPTTAAVRAALNAVDSARTYNSGTNINIDAQNNINAVASDIANGATTLVTGGTVYTALLDEQDKNTTDKYEVNKNGVWTDIGDAVSGDTNVTVTPDSTTGALTIGVTTSAITESATGLAVAGDVYDAIAQSTQETTYLGGSNISIDTTNHISADTGAITSTATTLVDGATVYAALANEQDKNTTDKYEVNKNGVWTDIGDAVSGDTNYIGVTANDSTGALTVSALTTAVADSATGLATAQGVYDYVQGITNGNNIPAQDPSKCTATIPCALVAINNNGNMEQHWYTMATDSHAGGVLADAQ